MLELGEAKGDFVGLRIGSFVGGGGTGILVGLFVGLFVGPSDVVGRAEGDVEVMSCGNMIQSERVRCVSMEDKRIK